MKEHRAVEPIIATLLMVAVAVVGGILIFVFTQGFFADEQVVGPTVDNIRIFGYDVGNDSDVEGYTLDDVIGCSSNDTALNNLATGDCFTIYVINLGDKPVGFQSVRAFGVTHSSAAAATSTTCTSTASSFVLMTGSDSTEDSVLEPNENGTICIEYGGTAVKAGRTIPVQLETTNGQVSQINVINGGERGQEGATTVVWTLCASENGFCAFTGPKNVRYGANNIFFTQLIVANGVNCTNAVFGDPVVGVGKTCEYSTP